RRASASDGPERCTSPRRAGAVSAPQAIRTRPTSAPCCPNASANEANQTRPGRSSGANGDHRAGGDSVADPQEAARAVVAPAVADADGGDAHDPGAERGP